MHLLIWIYSVPGCVFISSFTSLVGISVGIASSAVGLIVCIIMYNNCRKLKIINQ